MRAPPTPLLDLPQFVVQRLGLGRAFGLRQLIDGGLQVAQHLGHAGAVRAVEGRQLVEDIVPAPETGMAKHLPAGHHLEGDAAEAQAHLDARVPRVLALNGTFSELVEAGGEAGQGGFEVVADLAVEGGAFVDQIAAVTG